MVYGCAADVLSPVAVPTGVRAVEPSRATHQQPSLYLNAASALRMVLLALS